MQRKTTAQLAVNIFYWFVLLGLTCLLATKSFVLPVTNDEAYSFFLVKTNYWKAMAGTANTHWLNSFFIRVFTFLAGDAPGYWRLQSVLAGAGYIFLAKRIAQGFDSAGIQLICFSVLVFNPYLLDYFSMARGYGLAVFFILLSVYYLQQFMEKRKDLSLFYGFLSLCAAVVSNYTALYFLLSSVLLLTFFMFRNNGRHLKGFFQNRVYTKAWVFSVAVSSIATANLFFIKYYTHDLEFGATHSFARDSFGSLLQYSSFLCINEQAAAISGYALFFVILLCSFFIIRKAAHSKLSAAVWIASVMLLTIVLSIFFFYLFKTPYVTERGALVLYPLTVLILCYAAFLLKRIPDKPVAISFMGLLALLFIVNTAVHFKFSSTLDWKDNADTPFMLKTVEEISSKNNAVKVGMHRLHYGVYKNYYSQVSDRYKNLEVELFSDEELADPNQQVFNKLSTLDFIVSTKETSPVLFSSNSAIYKLVQKGRLADGMVLQKR